MNQDEERIVKSLPEYLDGAIIGKCMREDKWIYSYSKCVELFMEHDKCTLDEAVEHMDFNYVDAYLGPKTPIYMYEGTYERLSE